MQNSSKFQMRSLSLSYRCRVVWHFVWELSSFLLPSVLYLRWLDAVGLAAGRASGL